MKPYITIREPANAEFVIKKSRFIGQLYPADTEEQAAEQLAAVRKTYWNATHNCMAMVIGEKSEYMRCSDDGEPQGTAGVPMLEVLKAESLTNVLAVGTRYFGGTLLGAAGLVRAYGRCVSEAVRVAQKVEMRPIAVYEAEVPFKIWGKTEAMLKADDFRIKDVSYESCVRLWVYIGIDREDAFEKRMADLSGGSVVPRKMDVKYVEFYI